jgi:hypothetical protein
MVVGTLSGIHYGTSGLRRITAGEIVSALGNRCQRVALFQQRRDSLPNLAARRCDPLQRRGRLFIGAAGASLAAEASLTGARTYFLNWLRRNHFRP